MQLPITDSYLSYLAIVHGMITTIQTDRGTTLPIAINTALCTKCIARSKFFRRLLIRRYFTIGQLRAPRREMETVIPLNCESVVRKIRKDISPDKIHVVQTNTESVKCMPVYIILYHKRLMGLMSLVCDRPLSTVSIT